MKKHLSSAPSIRVRRRRGHAALRKKNGNCSDSCNLRRYNLRFGRVVLQDGVSRMFGAAHFPAAEHIRADVSFTPDGNSAPNVSSAPNGSSAPRRQLPHRILSFP